MDCKKIDSQYTINFEIIQGPFCLFCLKKIPTIIEEIYDEETKEMKKRFITQCNCKLAKKEQKLLNNLKKAEYNLEKFYKEKEKKLEKNKLKLKLNILKKVLKDLNKEKDGNNKDNKEL